MVDVDFLPCGVNELHMPLFFLKYPYRIDSFSNAGPKLGTTTWFNSCRHHVSSAPYFTTKHYNQLLMDTRIFMCRF